MQACEFTAPTRFLIGTVSKGLTNQRLGTLSYLVLAAALNRTLILSSVLSGNQIMCRGQRSGCLKASLSDTIIGCDCSTFSKEVVRLRSLGRGAPKDTWTFSGPPYPQQRGLAPFLRDDPIYHSAVRSPYLPRGDLQRSATS